MIINEDEFGNPLIPLFPKSKQDTLMACFAIFVYNCESQKSKIKQRLLSNFESILGEQECYRNSAVKSLVLRLNSIDPRKYPKSAHDIDYDQLKKEGVKFLQQARSREGYIFDKITYIYLFAELYNINVTVIHPKEEIQSIRIMKAYYTLFLFHNFQQFYLLIPEKQVKKIPFEKPLGYYYKKRMQLSVQSVYELRKCCSENKECNVVTYIAPPSVQGYKVHSCHFFCEEDNTLFVVFPRNDFKIREAIYIYLSSDELVGYVDLDSKTNAYFYVKKKGNHSLYVVPAESQEEAKQIINIEMNK
jgi:hypothetical protein